MYLSRLWLNPRDRYVQRDLSDIQAIHRTVMSGFPQQEASQTGPRSGMAVLFRQEQDSRTGNFFLLVQSRPLPDWSTLPPHYLLPSTGDEPICKPLSPLLGKIQNGVTLRFRLRANPTKKASPRDTVSGLHCKGKRVDLRGEEDQRVWLEKKGQQHGFRILACQVQDEPRLTGRRPDQNHPRSVVVAPVLFQGVLQITDDPTFRRAVEEGVGPGRAYGCGLLSVALLGA